MLVRCRPTIVALAVCAAGLAAGSFAFAHLDYRQRETYYVHLQLDKPAAPPSTEHLFAAIALGVPAAMTTAAALALTVLEWRSFRTLEPLTSPDAN